MTGTRGKEDCQDVLAHSLSLHNMGNRCAVWAARYAQLVPAEFLARPQEFAMASFWLGVAKPSLTGQGTLGASTVLGLRCRLCGSQAPGQAPSFRRGGRVANLLRASRQPVTGARQWGLILQLSAQLGRG